MALDWDGLGVAALIVVCLIFGYFVWSNLQEFDE